MVEFLVSILVLLISLYLFKKSIGSFRLDRLNMISYLLYSSLILQIYIGSVMVVMNLDIHFDMYFWAITGHAFDEARLYGWLSVLYTMIMLPIGMIFANFIFLKKINASPLLIRYQDKNLNFNLNSKVLFLVLLLFTILSTLAIAYVFIIIGHFPILGLLSGLDDFVLRQMRGDAKIAFNGIPHIRDFIAIPLTQLLSYAAYISYKQYGQLKFKLLFIYLFMLSVLILTYALEKAPVVLYVLSFLFLKIYLGYKLDMKKLFIMMMLSFVFLVFFFFAITGADNVFAALIMIFERVFVGSASAVFLVYEYFPQQHDFIGWAGASNWLANLVGEELKSTGRILFEIYNPKAVEAGTAGFLDSLFVAGAWSFFGLVGVLLSPLWVGFFIQSIHLFMLRLPKNSIFLALYIYQIFHWSVASGFAALLNPISLFVIMSFGILIYLVILFFERILKNNENKRMYSNL